MNCKECDSKKTSVVWTQKQPGGVRRLRKCHVCGFKGYSGEVWLAQLPPPEPKFIYTEAEVSKINKKEVLIRRKNEDRRHDEKTK